MTTFSTPIILDADSCVDFKREWSYEIVWLTLPMSAPAVKYKPFVFPTPPLTAQERALVDTQKLDGVLVAHMRAMAVM
jgi:hypothetical protein